MYASTWICTKVSADPTVVLDSALDADDDDSEVVDDLEL